MRKLLTLVTLALIAPAISQAKTLDELLADKGVIKRAEAKGAAMGGSSKVYYNDGSRFEFDNGFTAQVNTVVRTGYTYTDGDDDVAENNSSFNVDNARVILSGTALHNEFSYMVEAEFANGANSEIGDTTSRILDAWIAWHPCENSTVKMGSFRTFVSRQWNTDVTKLQFVDRTDASNYFTQGRQNGIMGSMKFGEMVNVSAGMWNGLSDGEGQNLGGNDTDHAGAVAVRLNPWGNIDPFSEGDVEDSDGGMSIGFGYHFDASNVAGEQFDTEIYNADFVFKQSGFSFAGEFFYADQESDLGGEDFQPLGFYAQAGFFVQPKLELAVRYGHIDYDDQGDVEKSHQAGASINYYWWAHHLKAQLGYDHYIEENAVGGSEDLKTNRYSLLLSGWF